MKRHGQVIGLKPEHLEEYVKAHAAVWPGVLARISQCNIRNYSIFHRGGQLFAYFEYLGPEEEFGARIRELALAPRMREWWDIMEPMQVPVDGRRPDEWWAGMEEFFHAD